MKTQFTEEQIIGVLKEAEAGLKPSDLRRKHVISEATYLSWKAKFGEITGLRSAAAEGTEAGEQ